MTSRLATLKAGPNQSYWSWWVPGHQLLVGFCLLWVLIGGQVLAAPIAQADSVSRHLVHHTETLTSIDTDKASADWAAKTATMMPPDIQRILDRGTLVVAVLDRDNPPFFMDMDDDTLGGLDIQLAQAIADQLDVKLELNRSADTFNGVVDTVFNRDSDMAISKISRTMKRAVKVRFSTPYLTMRQGLLVNRLQLAQQTKSDSVTATIRDLSGEVGVIKGSSYVGFLKQKFPQATIVELDSWSDIVTAVSSGEISAGYRDELEIKKVVLTKPDAALQLQTVVLTDTQDALSVVLPWESQHLLAFTNQYLDTLESEYTVDGIIDTYADYWSTQTPGS